MTRDTQRIATEYTLPDRSIGFYLGTDVYDHKRHERCFCFASRSASLHAVYIKYIPVKGAGLRNRNVTSDRGIIRRRSVFFDNIIPKSEFEAEIRKEFERLREGRRGAA